MTYSILISSKHLQSFLEIVAAVAVLLAFCRPAVFASRYGSVEHWFRRLSRRRGMAAAFAAGFPLTVRVLLLPWFPVPQPHVHDEFSYLLMGDTFAHGRLANPSPPSWQHFETEYVLMQPTYASQYQPAQGLMMAAGELLAGQPWWGVWASIGLMCAALCWAAGEILPLPWALFGALAAGLQFGVFGFWMNSYFGGGIAAAGGALIAGGLARMRRHPASSSAVAALGLVVLFASRPFEALLWSAAAVLWTLLLCRRLLPKVIPAAAVVLMLGASGLAFYNTRVTGKPLDPPYWEARRTYGTPQSYWWQPAVAVNHFNNPQLRANYSNQLNYWNRRNSAAAVWDSTWRRLRDFWRFFIGPFLTPALLFLGFALRDRRLRPWLLISVPFVAEHATYHAWYPQQSASETILIVLLLVQCWRHLRVWRLDRAWGLALSRNLIAGLLAAIVLLGGGRMAGSHLPLRYRDVWASLLSPSSRRDQALRYLRTLPGKHLVFVQYTPTHPFIDEWVFNEADIPNAKVVFSRQLDPVSDLALIEAMGDRDLWLAEPDAGTLHRLSLPGYYQARHHPQPRPSSLGTSQLTPSAE